MLPGVSSAGYVRRGPTYYPFGIRHGMRGEVLTHTPAPRTPLSMWTVVSPPTQRPRRVTDSEKSIRRVQPTPRRYVLLASPLRAFAGGVSQADHSKRVASNSSRLIGRW